MRGKDGRQIESEVGAELDYLSQISRRLGIADLVEDYFAPVVGDWNDLHDEAERWHKASGAAETITKDLLKPLGRLDSAWQGASADSFVDHMQKVGLAGHDLTDTMTAMGDALDETAEGIRGIVQDMSQVFRDTADVVSGAAGLPLDGDARIIGHLDELREPAKEMYESVRDILEAFLRLCDGLSGTDTTFTGPKMDHRYPEENWTFTEPKPQTAPHTATGPPKPETVPASVGAGTGSMSGTLPTGGGSSVGGSVGGGSVGGGSVGGGSADTGVGSAPAAAQHGPTQHGGSTAVQETPPDRFQRNPARCGGPGRRWRRRDLRRRTHGRRNDGRHGRRRPTRRRQGTQVQGPPGRLRGGRPGQTKEVRTTRTGPGLTDNPTQTGRSAPCKATRQSTAGFRATHKTERSTATPAQTW